MLLDDFLNEHLFPATWQEIYNVHFNDTNNFASYHNNMQILSIATFRETITRCSAPNKLAQVLKLHAYNARYDIDTCNLVGKSIMNPQFNRDSALTVGDLAEAIGEKFTNYHEWLQIGIELKIDLSKRSLDRLSEYTIQIGRCKAYQGIDNALF
ncbi:hypothetical protein OCU04_003441 [Sclerotinia nivalis]|uniref:Uncharacterized protein n=1 Tax=Sclerotinia nivalis TaxID=352851 RepID=A0A9X0ARX4_9HELO|nr:hypothetical protein OCU04_003441 [Sclerotinia nivalis]